MVVGNKSSRPVSFRKKLFHTHTDFKQIHMATHAFLWQLSNLAVMAPLLQIFAFSGKKSILSMYVGSFSFKFQEKAKVHIFLFVHS